MSSKESLRSGHIGALLKTGVNISLFYTSFCTYFPLSVLFCPFLKRSHLCLHALEYALELNVTGPLLGLRQFLTIERPVKMIKDAFYFMLRVFFIYELFSFLSWLFGYVEKRLDKKVMLNFKIYPVSQEVKAVRQSNLVS